MVSKHLIDKHFLSISLLLDIPPLQAYQVNVSLSKRGGEMLRPCYEPLRHHSNSGTISFAPPGDKAVMSQMEGNNHTHDSRN